MSLNTFESIAYGEFFSQFEDSELKKLRSWFPGCADPVLLIFAAIHHNYILFRSCKTGRFEILPIMKRGNPGFGKQVFVPASVAEAAIGTGKIAALPKTEQNCKVGWKDLGFRENGDYYLMIQ